MHEVRGIRRGAIVRTAVALVFVGLLAAGCGTGSSSDGTASTTPKATNVGVVEDAGAAQTGGKLVYGLNAETNGWNPASSQWAPSGVEVAKALFDTLSAYDSESKIQPNLAASFVPNADFTMWTINLRPGVVLHNGKPVNAALVKANQEFLKQSALTGAAYEPVDSFSTDGDLKVNVKMVKPWVNYPYALATQIGVVVDQDWLASGNADKPIGTGAFKLDTWTPDKEMVVKKNPDYWQKDTNGVQLPYLDEVDFRPITDDSSRSASLQKGDISIMEMTSAQEIVRFKELGDRGEFQVFNATSGETSESFIQLNTMAAPFNDIDARRALAYATNKTEYIDAVAEGLYEPANGPFAPSSKWYNPAVATTYPQFDLAKAKELVDKVKAKNGGTFSFKLIGPPSTTTGKGLQLLQGQWAAAGIDATIDTVEQAPLIVKVLTGDYQSVAWQQFASPHPLGDSIWWHPNTAKPIPQFALNFARNKDEEIGAKLDAARSETDPQKELEDYQFVQKKLDEDIPYIWLYHSQISIVARNDVVNVVNWTLPPNERGERKKGLELQDGAHPLAQVWIKRAG
jgi:ABC-type transport system substrate-binding protein